MEIANFFPVPVFVTNITGTTFQSIQREISTAYETLTAEDKFDWHLAGQSHQLSDPTFSTSFLDEFNLSNFKNELKNNVSSYLRMIDSKIPDFDYRIDNSWLTLNKKGSFAFLHNHTSSDISGCYYFQTTGNDGDIYFETPNRMQLSSYVFQDFWPTVQIRPEPGLLLLFPGWLDHGVKLNTTDSERVSVSFNLTFKRF